MIANNYRDTYLPNPISTLSTPRTKSFSTLILQIRCTPESRDKNRFCMHLINPVPYSFKLKLSLQKQEIVRAYNASEIREFPKELISLKTLFDPDLNRNVCQNLIGSYIRIKPLSIHDGWINTNKIEIIISEGRLELIRKLEDYKRSYIANL